MSSNLSFAVNDAQDTASISLSVSNSLAFAINDAVDTALFEAPQSFSVTPAPRSLLPPNATPWELALEATGTVRFPDLNTGAQGVQAEMNTAAIPAELLPWLAWGLKLEIWDSDWSEARMRWAVANSIAWHYLKGTKAGITAYLNLVDTELVAAVVPPARTYLSPKLTAAQRAAYLENFPQLRVLPFVAGANYKYASFTSAAYGLPEAFLGTMFTAPTGAYDRYTRKAELWQNGAQVAALSLKTIEPTDTGSISKQTYDQIVVPVEPQPQQGYVGALYPGAAGSGQAMVGAGFAAASIINVGVTTSFVFAEPRVTDQAIQPGLGLIDVDPTDVAQPHPALVGQTFLTSRAHLAHCCMPPSQAWQFIYQLWYVFNPSFVPPSRSAVTFLDWTRLGMPPYTAELQVNIEGQASKAETWGFVAGCLRSPMQSEQQINDALAAVQLSKSARDDIWVKTRTVRPIQPSDAITVGSSSAVVNAWVPDTP